MRIAILEDDPDQSELIRLWLEGAEHSVFKYACGSDFLRSVRRDSFDLYLLDWLLPDVSGLDVLRKLRDELHDTTPVLALTASDIRKLDSEDFTDSLRKRIQMPRLLAQVQSHIR